MSSLRKHPKSKFWFAIFWLPDGRKTTRSTKSTDRREAQRIADKYEDASQLAANGRLSESQARKVISDILQIQSGQGIASSITTDYVAGWLKRKELETATGTFERYAYVAKAFLESLGAKAKRELPQITIGEIVSFRDSLAKSRSIGSTNLSLKVVRIIFADAVRDGLVSETVATKVSILNDRKEKLERRPFTLEELARILDVATIEWQGIILFGFYAGQKLGDLAGLTWANINLQKRELFLTTQKTGRLQTLPLAKALIGYLEALPVTDKPDAPLFPECHASLERTGKTSTLSNQFYNILASAGLAPARSHQSIGKGRNAVRKLGGLSFHCLRHTSNSIFESLVGSITP